MKAFYVAIAKLCMGAGGRLDCAELPPNRGRLGLKRRGGEKKETMAGWEKEIVLQHFILAAQADTCRGRHPMFTFSNILRLQDDTAGPQFLLSKICS